MKKTGIYRIYNTKTDKSYVGQAIDIEVRWNGHKRELEEGCHHNVLLQRDWDKYGKSSFEFSILTECNPVELNVLEKLYMDLYNCTNTGYNVAEGNRKISKKYKEELLLKNKENKQNKEDKPLTTKKVNNIKETEKSERNKAWELCKEKLKKHIKDNIKLKYLDDDTFSIDRKFFEWYLKTESISNLLPWHGQHGLKEPITFRLYMNFWEVIGELVGEDYSYIDIDDKTIKVYPKSVYLNGELIQREDNKYLSYWKDADRYLFKKIRKREMIKPKYRWDNKSYTVSEYVRKDYGRIKVTSLGCPLLEGLFEIRSFMKKQLKEEYFKPLMLKLEDAISDLIIKSDKYFFKGDIIGIVEDRYIISKERYEDEYYILELKPKVEKLELYEFLLDNWSELADIKFISKGNLASYKGNRGLIMECIN